jgi:hypothetical protein
MVVIPRILIALGGGILDKPAGPPDKLGVYHIPNLKISATKKVSTVKYTPLVLKMG